MLTLLFLVDKIKSCTLFLAQAQSSVLMPGLQLLVGVIVKGQSEIRRRLHQITHFLVHVKTPKISTRTCINVMYNLRLLAAVRFCLRSRPQDKSQDESAEKGARTLLSPTIQSFSTTPGYSPGVRVGGRGRKGGRQGWFC